MAKKIEKSTEKKHIGFGKISSIIDNISKKTAIMVDKSDTNQTFIDTGIYVFNALLSKSILKGGVSKNRITILAGPPSCGKSYLCYNIARNAQKEGYNVMYIDTEFSIEKEELQKFGIDISDERFKLIRSNKVEDLKVFLTKLLDDIKKLKSEGEDVGKFLFILDSIGQLASAKEIEDALEGKNKADMSRAKAIKSLFRIINSDLGYLDIPLICTNHVYMSMDLFPQAIMGGGEGAMYSASTVIYMSIAKLKTGEESTQHDLFVKDLGQSGIVVTAKSRKNRLAKPMQIKFEINHKEGTNPYKGLEEFCTFENFEKIGIAKVKKVEVKKGEFKFENNESTKGAKYYIKHLDKTLSEKLIFNSEVFTQEILEKLDPIISDFFSYSSHSEQLELLKKIDAEYSEYEKDIEELDIELGDDDLFDK